MEKLKEFKIFDGGIEEGKVFYFNVEKNMGFGLLENGNYLLLKKNKCYEIKRDLDFFMVFLPLLELDILDIQKNIKQSNYNLFHLLPIEKIILTAFHKGFSIYWKEKAILWLEKLNYNSPNLRNEILPLANRESPLPIKMKKQIKNIFE